MSDNKKYYYLKFKENFFDSEEMIILEGMQDGYLYSNILIKLYLRSLKNEGKLMFNNTIPYNSTILAQIVRHNVGVVEKALTIFSQLGLIEILDNGAIYLLNIQNYIGQSSSEADRQREYQARIKEDKIIQSNGIPNKKPCKKSNGESNGKSTPEIEIEKKKEIKTKEKIVVSDFDIDIEPIPRFVEQDTWILFKEWWKLSREQHKLANTRAAFDSQIKRLHLNWKEVAAGQKEAVMNALNHNKGKTWQNIYLPKEYERRYQEIMSYLDGECV
jgi:predicted phage replisome organizer